MLGDTRWVSLFERLFSRANAATVPSGGLLLVAVVAKELEWFSEQAERRPCNAPPVGLCRRKPRSTLVPGERPDWRYDS